jgi:hypothetical protein
VEASEMQDKEEPKQPRVDCLPLPLTVTASSVAGHAKRCVEKVKQDNRWDVLVVELWPAWMCGCQNTETGIVSKAIGGAIGTYINSVGTW